MVDIEITDQAAELAGALPVSLSSIESDTIGEILNISMGSAATAVSTLLGRGVSITTSRVSIEKSSEMELKSFEPAVGIEIKYVEGLNGSNFMIMKLRDIRAIVSLLIEGEVQADGDSEEELDEIQISAISEIMNQMMGASSTALASFFGKSINISTPEQFDPQNIKEKIEEGNHSEYVVSVMFLLEVEGVLNSEFVTIMPIGFTKELVANVMSLMDDPVEEAGAQLPLEQNNPQHSPQAPTTIMSAPTPSFTPASPTPPVQAPPVQAPPMAPPAPTYSNNPPPTSGMAAGGHEQAKPQPKQEPVSVQMLKLTNFDDEDIEFNEGAQDNFSLILGVPLDVSVEIGKTKLPVKNILDIRQGSIIELDRQAGDPADIIVNGQLIARGDVVVIDDNFGVRITEIVSQKEIAKQLN